MSEDMEPNSHDAIRKYWTRQWTLVNPHVEPLSFVEAVDGSIVVEVNQTIRDGHGNPVEEKGLKDKTKGQYSSKGSTFRAD